MLHIASVDEEELAGALLACRLGFAHEAVDLAHRGVDVECQEMLVYFLAEDVHNALAQGTCLEAVQLVLVVVQRKGYVGIDKHYALEGGDNVF